MMKQKQKQHTTSTVHNSEETTRSGTNAECHSIIDLTLTKVNVNLRWSIADESTGSGHEILVREVIEENQGGAPARSPPGGISGSSSGQTEPRKTKKSERKCGQRLGDDGRKRQKRGDWQWQPGGGGGG